jgi:hypothetical protein
MLGSFFVGTLPLVAALWWHGSSSRLLVVASCAACGLIIIATASSTPLVAVIVSAAGAAAFLIRYHMRWVRWSILLVLVGLHLIMNAPVWHLVARISVIGGNSAWQRFALIDGAIRHLDEWWLIGSDKGTGHWGYFTFDTTNFYIVQGQHGGLVLLVLFVAAISVAFRACGRTCNVVAGNPSLMALAWGMAVALLAHVVNFFGVAYFGQVWMGWFLLLGMIGSTSANPMALCVARPGTRGRVFSPASPARPGAGRIGPATGHTSGETVWRLAMPE